MSGSRNSLDSLERQHCERWQQLCHRFLPLEIEGSNWRYNRERYQGEPAQGWKLHISSTVLEACDVLQRVAPFLSLTKVQFKAPTSLDVLAEINSGLSHGYHQIGKFISIYPSSDKVALALARQLDGLTKNFVVIDVPFDEQYAPGSSVFYRYGAFSKVEIPDENGMPIGAILGPEGSLVADDRKVAVPTWLHDPFPAKVTVDMPPPQTPLETTYRVFRALRQRGKGGTYEALDIREMRPKFCIVKEGRKNGELSWNGQDGYALVRNEFEVLRKLQGRCDLVPKAIDSFEVNGNFYFVMERINGPSLWETLLPRRRRLSVTQIVRLALQIISIVRSINAAGFVWNDCKPGNLIVCPDGSLRPIDFENSYPIDGSERFDWRTKAYSIRANQPPSVSQGPIADCFSVGAVIYFLLTGVFYDSEKYHHVRDLRRNVPDSLRDIVSDLLSTEQKTDIQDVERRLCGVISLRTV